MSAPTHSPDVSIHLERHSHTPPRDGASSVGPPLNYSSSSIPVRPPALPHTPSSTTSVTLASVRRDRRQTKACWHSLTRSLWHENQQLRRGERSLRRTRIPDVPPNVLIWLCVPSETTTLRGGQPTDRLGEAFVGRKASRFALQTQTIGVLWLREFSWFGQSPHNWWRSAEQVGPRHQQQLTSYAQYRDSVRSSSVHYTFEMSWKN